MNKTLKVKDDAIALAHKKSKRKYQYLTGIVIILGVCYIFAFYKSLPKHKIVIFNGHQISTVVADTPAAQQTGLSDTKSLTNQQGMLFIFKSSNYWGFWMKKMQFPLDIIWINSDLKVVTIDNNLQPSTYPKIFYPSKPSLYVVEVNAGVAKMDGLKVGQQIKID